MLENFLWIFYTVVIILLIFPLIHGTGGEDGCLQGSLESAQIPYVGSGVLASAICMDKDITKRLAMQHGIKVTPYISFMAADWQHSQAELLQKIDLKLTFPLFVKPANTGSSIGINKVKYKTDLIKTIENALLYDSKVLVEQGVNAHEIELAVLENLQYGEPPLVSIAGEIITSHEFYNYAAKYLDEKNLQLLIPAQNLSITQVQELTQLAREIFLLTGCEGMARVDFFVDKKTNEIILNELNTIPGFTHLSMYPLLWQASGLAYADLLDKLLQLAIAKQARKRKISEQFIP
jgi:D-alanine-D-alanine ligase